MTRARTLRRNSTKAEQKLWALFRNRGLNTFKFRRQQPTGIDVADFICFEARLIVEVDGGQHTQEADATRTRGLEAQGLRVIPFWNKDVLANPGGVALTLQKALKVAPSPARSRSRPLPRGER